MSQSAGPLRQESDEAGAGRPVRCLQTEALPLVQVSVPVTGPAPAVARIRHSRDGISQKGSQGRAVLAGVGRLFDGCPVRSPQHRPVDALALRGEPLPPIRAEPAQEDRHRQL